MSFLLPVPSRDGDKIFVVGRQERGELVRYDAAARQFVPYLKDLSAEQLDYSRDRDWVAYVTYPEGDLWRRKLDGAERLQLSFAPMQAALPRWSPDGKRIAFVGRLPGKSWKVHLVSSEGGAPRQLMPEDRVELDPNWSPDGNTLVFVDYSAATIHLFDLRTGQVSMLPGSEGLHSPRWSPDGRYIAATLRNGQGMTLYDFTTQKWTEIARQSSFWQFWSRDSKHLYFSSGLQRDPAIFRLRIADRSVEQMASLADFRLGIGLFGSWTGLTADESPLALRDVGTQDIYALEWRIP
jgi:Tol biopolymer transport system component